MLQITVLGCGASAGVPRIGGADGGGDWGACNPANPRNRRSRCAIVVEDGTSRILVDTGPDLRQQLLAAGLAAIDGVFWTHGHGDHLNGIDELRQLNRLMNCAIPVWSNRATISLIEQTFPHVFAPLPPNAGYIKPTLVPQILSPPESVAIGTMDWRVFAQDHGFGVESLGFRIGNFAYSTDLVRLDSQAFDLLQGVDCWIVDCLQLAPHPTHSHLAQSLEWIERVGAKQAFLTHLDIGFDYDELKNQLPSHIAPAYDGLVINLS